MSRGLYDRTGYGLRIDFGEVLEPPLDEEDVGWVDDVLRQVAHR